MERGDLRAHHAGVVALAVGHLGSHIIHRQQSGARDAARLTRLAQCREGGGDRDILAQIGERAGQPAPGHRGGVHQRTHRLADAAFQVIVRAGHLERELPIERVILRQLQHRHANLHQALLHVELADELLVEGHPGGHIAHQDGIEAVLCADNRAEGRLAGDPLGRFSAFGRSLLACALDLLFRLLLRAHHLFQELGHALDRRLGLGSGHREGDRVGPGVHEREEARLHLRKGPLLAQTVRPLNHLGNQGHVARRTRDHNNLAVLRGLDGEARVLHPQFQEHLAHLLGLHIGEVGQNRLNLAGAIDVERRAVVIPRQIMERGQAVEKLPRRHLAKVPRERPLHLRRNHHRHPLGHRKAVQRLAQVHPARHQCPLRHLPRNLPPARGLRRADAPQRPKRQQREPCLFQSSHRVFPHG